MGVVTYRVGDDQDKGTLQIFVQTSDTGRAAIAPVSANLDSAIGKFEEQIKPVARVAKALLDAVQSAQPKKVEIEFGVELGAKAGIPMITSGEASANFKVMLSWEK